MSPAKSEIPVAEPIDEKWKATWHPSPKKGVGGNLPIFNLHPVHIQVLNNTW